MKWNTKVWVVVLGCALLKVQASVAAADIGYAEGTELIGVERADLYVEDKPAGRVVFVGANKSKSVVETKGDGLFRGIAKSCSPVMSDLVHGSGVNTGMCKGVRGNDSYVLEFNGYCVPLTGQDGKSSTRCQGAWKFLPGVGTGKFAGVTGIGLWWGQTNAAGEFEEQWNGHYQK